MACLVDSRRRVVCAAGLGALLALGCGSEGENASSASDCALEQRCDLGPDSEESARDDADHGPPAEDDDGAMSGGGSVTGIPCAVRDVLAAHCARCHASPPAYGAPMALLSHADFAAAAHADPARPTFALVQERINTSDAQLRMPPASQPQLGADELATLNAWLDDGAPQRDEACTDEPGAGDDAPVDTTGLDCYAFRAHAPDDKTARYAVGAARDAYVNFEFTAPWEGVAYGIVARPLIDNAQVLHHWLLFQQGSGIVDGRVADSSGVHPEAELVHGWAPGGKPLDYREHGDVGVEFPAGTGFAVELHYNSDDAAALDASGVEVCVQKQAPANIAGVSWLGTDLIFGLSAQGTCDPSASEPIHILGVSPHMHLKGRHMTGVINRADGSSEILHDGPFSFADQTSYRKDIVLMPGDTITTSCTYSDFSVFGTKTTDEMCYLFTTAYPKGALADGGLGSRLHGSGSCLGL
jgi:hypothetical protein